MIIRKADAEDIKALLSLLEQLGYPTTEEDLKKRFDIFIKNKGYGVAIAEREKKILGFVAWSQSVLFVSDKSRIHIEGLIVDQKYRGQGIGKRLMLFVEEVAKTIGPVIIDLTSGLRRAKDGSHDFYRALGYHNEGPMAKLYLRKDV